MTMLSFAVLIVVAGQTGDRIEISTGLAKRSPFLSIAMLLAMASLAGIPFTTGFLGKFFIFDAAIRQHQNHAARRRCHHGRMRFLLLPEGRAGDVLGNVGQHRTHRAERLVPRDHDSFDGRHHRPGRLPATNFGCVATATRCRFVDAVKRPQSLSSTFQ